MKKMLPNRVVDLIPDGSDNAISMSRLVALSGAPERSVRKAVELARNEGIAIAVCGNGYYRPLPDDYEKLKHYYHARHHAAMTTLTGLKATRRLLQQYETDAAMENMKNYAKNKEK